MRKYQGRVVREVLTQLSKAWLFAICCVTAGCKVAVIVGGGGEVQSIGSGTCMAPYLYPPAGTICIHEVSNTNYSETFTAVPEKGWSFVKWQAGDDFLCAGSTNPSCRVSNVNGAGNETFESLVDSEKAMYLMPVFVVSDGDPIIDTVTVGAREWVQPDLFRDVRYSGEIRDICPQRRCEGSLRGYDLTGWTWASVADLNKLLNHYIGFDSLGPGEDLHSGRSPTPWARAFFEDGWRSMSEFDAVVGHLWDGSGGICINCYFGLDHATTLYAFAYPDIVERGGGWFYRDLD